MKQKRHSTEEIIRILRDGDGGKKVEELCREHNILPPTYSRETWAVCCLLMA